MRGVGSPDNVFVNESFMDELAAAAGADAIDFRLRHLRSDRHIGVLKSVAERASWEVRPSGKRPASGDLARGRGVAVLGADNIFTGERDPCVATVCEVAVNPKIGVVKVERVVIAQDCGLVVNPDAVKNQLEGAFIQSISRALMEEATFNRSRVTSLDWASYPIIRFPDIPDEIDIVLANRLDLPPMRVGEPASETVWPAIANAIYDAVGVRLRRLRFTPSRISAAFHAG
jgi:nicotinate dehydrogenase subunit B